MWELTIGGFDFQNVILIQNTFPKNDIIYTKHGVKGSRTTTQSNFLSATQKSVLYQKFSRNCFIHIRESFLILILVPHGVVLTPIVSSLSAILAIAKDIKTRVKPGKISRKLLEKDISFHSESSFSKKGSGIQHGRIE